MVLKNFYINVFVRVLLIVASSLVLSIVLQHLDRGYYYTLLGMILLIAFQTFSLINQVNKTNVDLENFLSSIQDQDSSFRFAKNSSEYSFRKLHDRLNNLNILVHDVKMENERTRHFLQRVVDHLDIGLLAFDKNGRIEIFNRAASRFFNVQPPRQLSSIKTVNDEIYNIILSIKPGKEILHKRVVNNLSQSILVKATELCFESNRIKLVSFQDITSELDKKEMDSWQKLIRVLTHEIMNSVSPITSLTSVISGYFKMKGKETPVLPGQINPQIIEKTLSGLNTIEETGKGLLEFVNNFRDLTSLPKPNLSRFTVDGLFLRCKLLMESTISNNVKISTDINPEDIAIVADYAQVEQTLINLIKNAAEALSERENGFICLKAFCGDGEVLIQVEDNGVGIPDAMIDNIFVPFFTTKENGSGIGLSLSKQIMQNHKGTILVNSVLGKGSKFILKFPF